MTALTPAALAEMEQRSREAAAAWADATPGPWAWRSSDDLRSLDNLQPGKRYGKPVLVMVDNGDGGQDVYMSDNDRHIVVEGRTAVPALAADVAALVARVRELEAMLDAALAFVPGHGRDE